MASIRKPTNAQDLSFDAEALKTKYREERDKRLNDKGMYQYREIEEGVLRHYADDPYSEPLLRLPVDEEVEALVIGGGYGGLLVAVRLIEAGITNIRIVEKAGDFGGTWYWNRYPGAACDIESYIYMPLCEELGYVPTEKYARAPELWEHAKNIGRHFQLYGKAMFQTEVSTLTWDKAASRWVAATDRGDRIRARFVTTASGSLSKPKLPGVPGIETYQGHSFHTSRWDYDYTGGNGAGGLDKISEKRIGVIGTGATATQVVPQLAGGAKHLYVFQRTPSSIDKRLDGPTDAEWAKKLMPGWQQNRMDNFNNIVSGIHEDVDLVNDSWTDMLKDLTVTGAKVAAAMKDERGGDGAERGEWATAMQMADFRKMEQIRARVDSIVKDPVTANNLKPWYNQMCKRPCIHNEYLDSFNLPNVTLIDTAGKGINRITEKGIVANGREIELDCIVYATGFEFGTDYSRRMRTIITGRGGLSLAEHFNEGTRTLHGMHSHGFPNLYIVANAQASVTINRTHLLNEQAKHIAYIVKYANDRGVKTVEVSSDAEDKWIQTIVNLYKLQENFLRECTPGYYNNEGELSGKAARDARYGLGAPAFIKLLKEWRKEGTLAGMELDGHAAGEVKKPEVKNIEWDSVNEKIDVTVQTSPAKEVVVAV
jgi:cyclohexanone monooxygenase